LAQDSGHRSVAPRRCQRGYIRGSWMGRSHACGSMTSTADDGTSTIRCNGLVGGRPTAESITRRSSDLLGPYDLAWLLSRIADFGTEDAGVRALPQWRSDPPPPPLQFLVPEMLTFDASGSAPRALYFTDRGGFLRGVRRALRQEPKKMYEALQELVRQRQQQSREYFASLSANGSSADECDEVESHTALDGTGMAEATPASSRLTPSTRSKNQDLGSAEAKRRNAKVRFACVYSLLLNDGTEQRLHDYDVAARFGAVGGGRMVRWPAGSRLLQARFWQDGSPDEGKNVTTTVYRYHALKDSTNDPDVSFHPQPGALKNIHERYQLLGTVDDRNLVSAAPVLISQHISYFGGIELVSGEFEFTRDHQGQLWLVDARELLFASSVVRSSGVAAIGGGAEVPELRKMFRYLSEEALDNKAMEVESGSKYQAMKEDMLRHYKDMKDQHGIDALLRETDEVTDIRVPIFEGTDRQALARAFSHITERVNKRPQGGGAHGPDSSNGDGGGWQTCTHHHAVLPKTPRVPPQSLRGRKVAWTARPPSRGDNVAQRRKRAAASRVTAASSADSSQPTVVSRCVSAQSSQPNCIDAAANVGGDPHLAGSGPVDIVLTTTTQRLLLGSGPGVRPLGSTFDAVVGPDSAAAVPGASLLAQRFSARPKQRLVEVRPAPGAGASLGTISSGGRASSLVQAEPRIEGSLGSHLLCRSRTTGPVAAPNSERRCGTYRCSGKAKSLMLDADTLATRDGAPEARLRATSWDSSSASAGSSPRSKFATAVH